MLYGIGMEDLTFSEKTGAFDPDSAHEALVGLAAQGVIDPDQIDEVLDEMFGDSEKK